MSEKTYTTILSIKHRIEDSLGYIPIDTWRILYDIFFYNGLHEPVDEDDIQDYILPAVSTFLKLGKRRTKRKINEPENTILNKGDNMGETIMYSVDPKDGKVIKHTLPWNKDTQGISASMRELHEKAIAKYLTRGYTFEPPKVEPKVEVKEAEAIAPPEGEKSICPTCGFKAKSKFGLSAHMRSHNK